MSLLETYGARFQKTLVPLAAAIQAHLENRLKGALRIDRITARAKSVASFVKKATETVDGEPRYDDPLEDIQDQVGARIITFYKADIDAIEAEVKRWFRTIEIKSKFQGSEWEFGYFGRHMILLTPMELLAPTDDGWQPKVFELQIKTLFQHAWSECNHDLGYKPESPLTSEEKRLLALSSAQAWGADYILGELFRQKSAASEPTLDIPE